MEQVFLSLGSNLGDRMGNLRRAIAAIGAFAQVVALSDAFESEPVEFTAQPWFVNAVLALRMNAPLAGPPLAGPNVHADDLHSNTPGSNDVRSNDVHSDDTHSDPTPQRLIERLLQLERALGRQRLSPDLVPKGPRIIDLDIVLYGSRVIHTPALTVPHPAMHLRRFVLQPMAQIAPAVLHPVLHRSVLQLLQALPEDGPLVRRLAAFEAPGQ